MPNTSAQNQIIADHIFANVNEYNIVNYEDAERIAPKVDTLCATDNITHDARKTHIRSIIIEDAISVESGYTDAVYLSKVAGSVLRDTFFDRSTNKKDLIQKIIIRHAISQNGETNPQKIEQIANEIDQEHFFANPVSRETIVEQAIIKQSINERSVNSPRSGVPPLREDSVNRVYRTSSASSSSSFTPTSIQPTSPRTLNAAPLSPVQRNIIENQLHILNMIHGVYQNYAVNGSRVRDDANSTVRQAWNHFNSQRLDEALSLLDAKQREIYNHITQKHTYRSSGEAGRNRMELLNNNIRAVDPTKEWLPPATPVQQAPQPLQIVRRPQAASQQQRQQAALPSNGARLWSIARSIGGAILQNPRGSAFWRLSRSLSRDHHPHHDHHR